MAGTSQLTLGLYEQNKIRARGRVFFDLVRTGISLTLSLAMHLLILQWIALPGRHSTPVAQDSRIVLSVLNAKLIHSSGTTPTPNTSGQPPEVHEVPVTPKPTATNVQANPNESLPRQSGISGDIYYPRIALSLPPRLIANVDLSSVSAITGDDSRNVVLELFISAQGTIDRIEFEDGTTLDESVQDMLHELLLQLKFSSGEIDGMAVKSRIRIEVMFVAPPKNENKITQPNTR